MKTKIFLSALVLALVLIVGCSEQSNIISSSQGILQTVWADQICVTLFAGQTIDAGQVCVDVEGSEGNEQLVVTYTTTDGWELTEAHLWVDKSLGTMPQTRKGNPQVGLFPYQSGDITGATTYTFSFPLSIWGTENNSDPLYNLCGMTLYLSAHAALRNGDQIETGWGDGARMVLLGRGNWATYFAIILNCTLLPNFVTCEFSYAYDNTLDRATCFLDINLDGGFFNWGWTNGPLPFGDYSFIIYAGAGDCLLSNGTPVGIVTVNYVESTSTATVTYTMNPTYFLDETHLYVGSEILPRDLVTNEFTIAPGRFPHNNYDLEGATSDTYTVTGLTGDIYVVAHAVVCGTIP